MNDINFDEAMEASGLCPTYVDENTDFSKLPNPFRQLHPTLKACACGFVNTKYKFEKHMDEVGIHDLKTHGEVPYYG